MFIIICYLLVFENNKRMIFLIISLYYKSFLGLQNYVQQMGQQCKGYNFKTNCKCKFSYS